MCREALIVPETQQVSALFEQMRHTRAHMAFVIDEYGVFVGIVTLEDLLEEIVGEIHDETDEAGTAIDLVEIGDDEWEAGGLLSLSDLERAIGLTVPVDLDANILSGLIMNRLGRVPEAGDELIEGGFRLIVESIEDHRVGRARIKRVQATDPEPGSPADA